ncbi:MAG: GGDEF domain-containing protein [Fusobacteria bacterium]|nr:GGDEF domain-containing protein [Fusobacteriota bacterium]
MKFSTIVLFTYFFLFTLNFSENIMQNGVLNVKNINQNKIVELDGNWRYSKAGINKNEIKYIDGDELLKKEALSPFDDMNDTFTISLQIKEMTPYVYYGIEIPYIYGDYKFKIDEKTIVYQQLIDKKFFTNYKYIEIYSEKDSINIEIEITPHSRYNKIIEENIKFGTYKNILFKRDLYVTLNFGVVIFLMFTIIYFGYVLHKKIGINYITYAIMLSFLGITFQILNFKLLEIDYLLREKGKYTVVLFMLYFLFNVFINFFNIKIKKDRVKFFVIIVTIFNLVIPWHFVFYWRTLFFIFLMFFIFLILINILAILKKRGNSTANIISYFLILTFTISYYNRYCDSICFNTVVLVFAVMQFFVFVRKHYSLIKSADNIKKENEKMQEKLSYLNHNFEEELEKRTEQLSKKNELLEKIARLDGLTGIYNHKYIHEMLDKEFKRARRYKLNLSLIMADIDFFKKINDTYGHKTGDTVLLAVSKTIETVIRETDMVGRYGGEEFLIVCCETDINGGYILAERLREQIKNLKFDEEELKVTASFGVAELDFETDITSLIKKADTLLYYAKKNGRDQTRC